MRTRIRSNTSRALRAAAALRHRDDGSLSLEQVVIALALLGAAGLVVAAIVAAINSRLDGIV